MNPFLQPSPCLLYMWLRHRPRHYFFEHQLGLGSVWRCVPPPRLLTWQLVLWILHVGPTRTTHMFFLPVLGQGMYLLYLCCYHEGESWRRKKGRETGRKEEGRGKEKSVGRGKERGRKRETVKRGKNAPGKGRHMREKVESKEALLGSHCGGTACVWALASPSLNSSHIHLLSICSQKH